MSDDRPVLPPPPGPVPPPNRHELALMIWLAVVPTLTLLNVVLGDWLQTIPSVLRPLVIATIGIPIVIYGLMPQLQRVRARLIRRRSRV